MHIRPTNSMELPGTHQSPVMLSTSAFWFCDMKEDSTDSIIDALKHIRSLDIELDGIDISHPFRRNDPVLKLPRWAEDYLNTFELLTLHTSFDDLVPGISPEPADIKNRLIQIEQTCKKHNVSDFILHADRLEGCLTWMQDMLIEMLPGIRISLEFMDESKSYGNRPEHFHEIFSIHDGLGLVPDLAHLQDFSMQFHWSELIEDDILSEKITFIHVSNHANHIKDRKQAPNAYRKMLKVKHQLCQADVDRLDKGILASTKGIPRIIEGAVPPSEEGFKLLRSEIIFFQNN